MPLMPNSTVTATKADSSADRREELLLIRRGLQTQRMDEAMDTVSDQRADGDDREDPRPPREQRNVKLLDNPVLAGAGVGAGMLRAGGWLEYHPGRRHRAHKGEVDHDGGGGEVAEGGDGRQRREACGHEGEGRGERRVEDGRRAVHHRGVEPGVKDLLRVGRPRLGRDPLPVLRAALPGVHENEDVVGADAQGQEDHEHVKLGHVRDLIHSNVHDQRHRERQNNLHHGQQRQRGAPEMYGNPEEHEDDCRAAEDEVGADDSLHLLLIQQVVEPSDIDTTSGGLGAVWRRVVGEHAPSVVHLKGIEQLRLHVVHQKFSILLALFSGVSFRRIVAFEGSAEGPDALRARAAIRIPPVTPDEESQERQTSRR
eukprot:scaffold47_cov258-Pinguiococcus_pyrenoidosus.AAC.115